MKTLSLCVLLVLYSAVGVNAGERAVDFSQVKFARDVEVYGDYANPMRIKLWVCPRAEDDWMVLELQGEWMLNTAFGGHAMFSVFDGGRSPIYGSSNVLPVDTWSFIDVDSVGLTVHHDGSLMVHGYQVKVTPSYASLCVDQWPSPVEHMPSGKIGHVGWSPETSPNECMRQRTGVCWDDNNTVEKKWPVNSSAQWSQSRGSSVLKTEDPMRLGDVQHFDFAARITCYDDLESIRCYDEHGEIVAWSWKP